MNRRNDWKQLLKSANEDLTPHGYALKVHEPEEKGFYACRILKDGKTVETYAENYYEDELSDLVNEAWHYVKSNLNRPGRIGSKTIKERFLTCLNVKTKVPVLAVEKDGLTWWAIRHTHTAHLTSGRVRSGCQLCNLPDLDAFTYYGDGTSDRPDTIRDMLTFKWLLRDKME